MSIETLPALLARAVERAGERPGVTDERGMLTWRAFAGRVEGIAGLLSREGLGVGDRIALWLPNCADYLAGVFACARIGAVAVHVNTRFGAAELAYLLTKAEAVAIVTAWNFAPVDFPAVLAALPRGQRSALRLVVGRDATAGELAGLPVVPLTPSGYADDVATCDTPCLTFTTSGTTRGPKLVLHNQRAIASHACEIATAMRMDAPDTCVLTAVPLCGTFGHSLTLGGIAGGAHIVLMEQFDAARADALIRKHRVTHTAGGDDMLGRIAAAADGRPYDCLVFSGFARFTPAANASIDAAEKFGMNPRGLYGSSEVQALFSAAPDDRPLTDGGVPVCASAQIAIRDPDTGEAVAPGADGELCIRAPSSFVGYLGDAEATARAHAPDGFFRTGDLACTDGRGFVFKSRIGDSLRLGGFLVNPEEIEAFLQSLSGVAEAQVVGVEDGGARRAFAFVRADPHAVLDEAGILAACKNLARYKQPVRVAFLDAFPVTDGPNGVKIQRARLREMAAEAMRTQPVR